MKVQWHTQARGHTLAMQSTCVCTRLERRVSSLFQELERRASSPFQWLGEEGIIPVPGTTQAHTALQTQLPLGCSCGEHGARTISLYPSHNAPNPSRVIQRKRGTGCKLHVRTQGCRMGGPGCKEGCGMARLLPLRPCRRLPLLQKDAAFYHHPVKLTGTRINEFLISAPSFSSLPRGYTSTAPRQHGGNGRGVLFAGVSVQDTCTGKRTHLCARPRAAGDKPKAGGGQAAQPSGFWDALNHGDMETLPWQRGIGIQVRA